MTIRDGIRPVIFLLEVEESSILIQDVETKNIMTKSALPVGGYSINPYVGCTHGCKYCYASFMKQFAGHTEPWGTFLEVKHWPAIKNQQKYKEQRIVIGSVTDGYLPQEAQFQNTRNQHQATAGCHEADLCCGHSHCQKIICEIFQLKILLHEIIIGFSCFICLAFFTELFCPIGYACF